MSVHQIEIFAIVFAMLALFAWERLRYDLVASLALIATVLTGCLPADKAFSGFSNPVLIIIAAILVISRGVQSSGVFDTTLRRLLRSTKSVDLQIGSMTGAVTFLSAAMKNVGALGLFLPIALQTASRTRRPASIYLMPLAFGSLIGGTITLIGTSPNLLISSVRRQLEGKPFSMFDFTPVGLPLACLAVVFLTFGWRLLPPGRKGQRTGDQLFDLERYTTELRVRPDSPMVGKSVRDLEDYSEGDLGVVAIVRGLSAQRFVPTPNSTIMPNDVLTVRADAAEAKKIADAQRLEFAAATSLAPTDLAADDLDVVEAVVMPDSLLIGRSPRQLKLRRRHEISLVAVSRAGRAISGRLQDHIFASGDVLVIQGRGRDLADTLARIGCLPLADRGLNLARRGARWIPAAILGGALALALSGALPVDIAFFSGATAMVLFKQVTPKEAYEAIDWPIIIMLGALLPVGDAMRDTGASGLIADWLGGLVSHTPELVAVGLVLVAAMLLAPLMHHAATVVVMGPIAAAIAHRLELRMDPFLMAVALGASCDFLTPIGHQNNMLVMAPGGYRFGDYWRLGLPLSIMVAVVGTALIAWFWPLR